MTSSVDQNPWGVAPPPPTTVSEFFNAARRTVSLLVEGGSDARFWLRRVDRRVCQVFPMNGKANVWEELKKARAAGKPAFVAVLDADCERLEGTIVDDPDVVWTDFHDLETVLIASPALEHVLHEIGSIDRCEAFEKEKGIRPALLANAVPLGRLRWLSLRQKLDLTFKKMQSRKFHYVDYRSFFEERSWEVDVRKMVKRVLDFCNRPDLKVDALMQDMDALPNADPWQVVSGHDLVGILIVGLRSKLGSRTDLNIEDFQQSLRLAFEQRHIESTNMYAALKAWEQRHEGFRIFPS